MKSSKSSVLNQLANQVMQSVFFNQSNTKGRGVSKDKSRMTELLNEVTAKFSRVNKGGKGNVPASLGSSLGTLRRMLRAYAGGEYKNVPWKTVGLLAAGLIYFVSPIDFIPDVLPILGLTDDAALLLYIINSLREDIDAFQSWESTQFAPVKTELPVATGTPSTDGTGVELG